MSKQKVPSPRNASVTSQTAPNGVIPIEIAAIDATSGVRVARRVERRWGVERTIAWLNRNRRLAKDFEATIESAVAWIFVASVKSLSRRVARA